MVLRADEINPERAAVSLRLYADPPQLHIDCNDHPWSKVTSKITCTCLFIEYNELEESQALVSSTIPHSR